MVDSSRVVVSYWRKDVHEVLVNRLGLSLPRKSVVRITDRLDMTIVVDWDNLPRLSVYQVSTLCLSLTGFIVPAALGNLGVQFHPHASCRFLTTSQSPFK